ACRAGRAHDVPRLVGDRGHLPAAEAVPAADPPSYPRIQPHLVLPRRRRFRGRLVAAFGRLVVAADPSETAAELAGEEQVAELLPVGAAALWAGDPVGHGYLRPVPEHALRVTHLRSFLR